MTAFVQPSGLACKCLAGAIMITSALSASALSAQEQDMSVYIGQHPANAVDGVAFIDNPKVQAVVERALDDQSLRDLVLKQTRDHAFATNLSESDGRLYFYAYDPSHGSTDNWGISVSADGEDGAVCIAVGGTGDMSPPASWYREGRVIATSEDGCPDNASGLAYVFGS